MPNEEAVVSESRVLVGGCHCGSARIAFSTSLAPSDMNPRACDCSFCVKHGASYVSDPQGRLSIAIKDHDAISEYRQGTGSAKFLVCRGCGVLVAVVFDGDRCRYGAVNSRCIEGEVAFGPTQTVSPQRLAGEEKRSRWEALWTPGVEVTVSAR